MPAIDRREFLHACATGLAVGTISPLVSAWTPRTQGSAGGAKKMLFIFLTGGNDGVNTVIPGHDQDYSSANRPTLYIPPGLRLSLGNGGAAFHPKLSKLKQVFDIGEVAVLHRIGAAHSTLSHFAEQRFWQTAKPNDYSFTQGFAARWIDQFLPGSVLPAVSVSARPLFLFNGSARAAHVPDPASFGLSSDPAAAKLIGNAPGSSTQGSGLVGSFHQTPSSEPYDSMVRESGRFMAGALAELAQLPAHVPPPDYYPVDDVELAAQGLPQKPWTRTFFKNLKDATAILKLTDCRIAGIELDGFDNHTAQGGAVGTHGGLLHAIAHGIRSVSWDTQSDIWSDLLVVVASEFGRTSLENSSQGTDHGKATCTLVAGGAVVGGVYNCDPVSWPSGAAMFSENGKYVAPLTDYRAVLAEIFHKHFAVPTPSLDVVIPGWSGLAGADFQFLDFLA